MSKLKVLDLFSGVGGLSLGLERTAGFETVAFCEIDGDCRKVLEKHWPEVPQFKDVSKINVQDCYPYSNETVLMDQDELDNEDQEAVPTMFYHGEIDVICGGFPCQDISVAGKQKGLINEEGKTTRSGLWFEYKRLIQEIRPRYVIIENVANLRNNGLATVLQDLNALGYDAEWHIISARSVGSCHLRERIWIIAWPSNPHSDRSQPELSLQAGNKGEGLFTGRIGEERSPISPNSNNLRLWSASASEKEKSERWTERTAGVRDVFRKIYEAEPTVCRGDDGLSDRLHERGRKARVKQMGNAVVPQIPQLIGCAILQYEAKRKYANGK